MAKKRSGFSFHEHEATGRELRAIDRKLNELVVRVCAAYGPTSAASRAAERTLKSVNGLRSKLDDAVCAEHPDMPDKDVLSCYYGSGKRTRVE